MDLGGIGIGGGGGGKQKAAKGSLGAGPASEGREFPRVGLAGPTTGFSAASGTARTHVIHAHDIHARTHTRAH